MLKLSDLFVLQLLYEHYEEFQMEHFEIAFQKYFSIAQNKEIIRNVLMKYLFDIKFTKEELKQVIKIRKSRADKEELQHNLVEWKEYQSLNNGKEEQTKRL